MLKSYPDLDLSKFYPEAVNSDKGWGLALGVGGKEAEEAALYHRRKQGGGRVSPGVLRLSL